MFKPIKKGQTFQCIKSMEQQGELLFVAGLTYKSKQDHSITDRNGIKQFGFNEEMLQEHFTRK